MSVKPPGDSGAYRVRVTAVFILLVLSIALIVLYERLPERRDVITFAAAVIGGAATVYSAYFSAAALRLSVQLTRDGNTFNLLKVYMN